jgi:hypothetical protein
MEFQRTAISNEFAWDFLLFPLLGTICDANGTNHLRIESNSNSNIAFAFKEKQIRIFHFQHALSIVRARSFSNLWGCWRVWHKTAIDRRRSAIFDFFVNLKSSAAQRSRALCALRGSRVCAARFSSAQRGAGVVRDIRA